MVICFSESISLMQINGNKRYRNMTSKKPSDSTEETGIPELLTVHELAAILKLSHRSIWRLVRSRQLPAPIHLGSSTRWRADLIATWLKQNRESGVNEESSGE